MTSAHVKLIKNSGIAHHLTNMTSHGESPTPKEDDCVSVLLTPPRLGTPLARTPCSAALSHDLDVVQKSFYDISDVRRFMRIDSFLGNAIGEYCTTSPRESLRDERRRNLVVRPRHEEDFARDKSANSRRARPL